MADSPPKRVTRARAAKVAPDVETVGKAKARPTAKITTAAAKAAASAPPVKPKTVTKRKTKVDEVGLHSNEAGNQAEEVKEKKKAPVKKPAIRRKAKADEVPEEEPQQEEDPAPAKTTRGRPKKAPVTSVGDDTESKTVKPAVPKTTRGRPKKAPADPSKEDPFVEEPAPAAKKAVRTRAGTTSKAATTTATRKRVAFNEAESDKENRVPSPPKKEAKATGIRARAVRKPPVPTRTTRRVKADDKPTEGAEKPLPLSPKKVTQVSTCSESDDELATQQKTPVKALLKSPVKNPSPIKVSKLDLGAPSTEGSTSAGIEFPSKGFSVSVLATPARRPPPSPFKDALKDSAKKVQLGESLLGRQPFKAPAAMTAFTPAASAAAPSQPQFKSSLLGSPARRPPQTVGKLHSFKTPMRSASGIVPATEGPQVNAIRLPRPFETESMSSAFRATKSPGQIKVHKMTPPSKFTEDFDASAPFSMFEDGGISSMVAKPRPTPRPKSPLKSAMKSVKKVSTLDTRPAFSLGLTREVSEPRKVTIQSPRTTPQKQMESVQGAGLTTTPTEVVPESIKKAVFEFETPAIQYPSDGDSDDDLDVDIKDYRVSNTLSVPDSPTPANTDTLQTAIVDHPENQLIQEPAVALDVGNIGTSMTPLIKQLSGWKGASPDKNVLEYRQSEMRGIFSPSVPPPNFLPTVDHAEPAKVSPVKSTFFEDEMSVRADQDAVMADVDDQAVEEEHEAVTEPALSEASQEYGDENAPPLYTEHLALRITEQPAPTAPTGACTPTKIFPQRTFHTVSKVPLKPAAEDSPWRPAVKRSNSLSGPLSPRKAPLISASPLVRSKTVTSLSPSTSRRSRPSTVLTQDYCTPTKPSSTFDPSTPGTIPYQVAATPGRTPRADLCPTALKGAVVFVDVHTTEGADASSLFVELLSQMGARCVKTWSWNPRASISQSAEDDGEPKDPATPSSQKIGITHVVYKDGGKRTLEKVRWAKGAVSCVGVGWVLDCEKENAWLPESPYSIDTSTLPRGGHRRRKSMEPKALANLNGTLIPSTPQPAPSNTKERVSPTEEFLTFSSPVTSRRQSSTFIRTPLAPTQLPPSVPATPDSPWDPENLPPLPLSPMTPGPPLNVASLNQMTCPPKPQGLFPVTGRIEDFQGTDEVRNRLLMARRKSLQFAPRVHSPLGQGMEL